VLEKFSWGQVQFSAWLFYFGDVIGCSVWFYALFGSIIFFIWLKTEAAEVVDWSIMLVS